VANRKSFKRPVTKTSNPQPKNKKTKDWIIWAAWADRVTFEDIKRETGKSESEVIKIMRSSLKSSSFKLWRKRVHTKSIKNLKKFKQNRLKIRDKSYKKLLANNS
jgi:uncharacterized protein (TIGR03643 family)|tara:strand:- start:1890 stop:2204 length:315 start_codon:yes stop_codon:yes gene_type:complete